MKVGIVALLQETNTFAPGVTTIGRFEDDVLLVGEAVRDHFAGAHHEIGGFLAGLAGAGMEAVPIFAARAVPWGPIDEASLQRLLLLLRQELSAAGPLDGVLAAAHGATAAQQVHDVDGCWLSVVRQQIGPNAPLIGTLDPHANLSPKMVQACDALVAYRTNPHLDQRERGMEAARLMARTLRGEIRPRMAASYPPVVINIECQNTLEPPCTEWFLQLAEVLAKTEVLSASLLLGFPYADVEELGAASIVVCDDDPAFAQREADCLAHWLWRRREDFNQKPSPIAATAARAGQLNGPTCLLDVGDNIGGGGPGDATFLIHALSDACVSPTLACLNDPDAVRQAERVGTGGFFHGKVGGWSCDLSGPPVERDFRVRAILPGKFTEARPRHGGFVEFDQGPTAVLESDDELTLITTSKRTPPFSLGQITSCGVDPTSFKAIIAKGVHAPVAAYREVCTTFIRVDTPGVTAADMSRLTYRHRRSPLYPFEQQFCWSPAPGRS